MTQKKTDLQARPGSLVPSRIRTLMWLTAGAAACFALVRDVIGLVVLVGIVTIVMTPIILVEAYLYPKRKGFWYEWRHGRRYRNRAERTARAPRPVPSPDVAALRRRYGTEWSARARVRSRLFQDTPCASTVSRAAILLTLAEKMEPSGRPDAAKECYRLILERFSDTQQARLAGVRLAGRTVCT
jgi:hypothetical protein